MNTPTNPAPSAADNAPTPRTMEQIAQECAEKVCHEGCLLDRGVACELIATAIAQAVEQKDCKIANQAERIRYLEGATNHATGTPLSKATAECDQLQAALAAAQATAREAMEEADHYKRIFKSNGASMELMVSRIPTGGQVIDAVIRAAAVTADSPGVLVWSANAAEQIEAALAKIAEEGQAQP